MPPQLGTAIFNYWKAYRDSIELPPGQVRSWMEFPSDQKAEICACAAELIRASADHTGSLAQNQPTQPLVPFCPGIPIIIKWRATTVWILLWVQLKDWSEDQLSTFFDALPHNSVLIAVVPHPHNQEVIEIAQRFRSHGRAFIFAAPGDIDALAQMRWNIHELINYKVTKIFLEQAIDADAVYSEWQLTRFREDTKQRKARELISLNQALSARKDPKKPWLRHPGGDQLALQMSRSKFVLLVGKSSSGKSVLALTVAERLRSTRNTTWYLDIGNLGSKRISAVGLSIFRETFSRGKTVTVILDDLHTQPTIARALITYLRFLQTNLVGDRLRILGICWPGFETTLEEANEAVVLSYVDSADLRDSILCEYGQGIDQEILSRIRDEVGDDLFVLRLWLEAAHDEGILTTEELSRRVWTRKSRNLKGNRQTLERILFLAYLVGQFELDVPIAFLQNEAGATTEHISELIRNKQLLEKDNDTVAAPHRSYAKLMARHFSQNQAVWSWFRRERNINTAEALLVNYLESIDPSQIWTALKLIEDAGAVLKSKKSQAHIKMVVDIWKAIDALLDKMYEQQGEDPTWGRAISSAFFAVQAFYTVGKHQEAVGSLAFIRENYQLDKHGLHVNVENFSTVSDFDEIRVRMKREEEAGIFDPSSGLETSEAIDVQRMHTNWAAGLILGTEAYARMPDDPWLVTLAEAVENLIEPQGYFYPARVPWVSARILIGLGLCGRTIHNSAAVQKAVDWFLRSRKEGGAREGIYWLPGTDGWNTVLETTAMSIIALRAVGVPANNKHLETATRWVVSQMPEWTRQNHELDGAVALEAYLRMGGDWGRVRNQALYLANWANSIALWRNATESAQRTQEQSCRAAQVATFLIESMWKTLRDDVPQLLVAFGVESSSVDQGDLALPTSKSQKSAYEWDIALSYASEDRDYVMRVARCLEAAGVKVFYDEFERVRSWGKFLPSYLDEIYRMKSKFCVLYVSVDYAAKAFPRLEAQSALARALDQISEYILPVRFDDTAIPGLNPAVAYVDATTTSAKELCKMIIEKINM